MIRLKSAKGDYQFASAHFLVGMGDCERLHGHNYSVSVEVCADTGEDRTVINFHSIGPVIREICSRLDHKFLIAEGETRHKIEHSDDELEITFKHKRFVFPKSDVVLLPIDATTVERLSEYVAKQIAGKIADQLSGANWIEAYVGEGPWQGASYRLML